MSNKTAVHDPTEYLISIGVPRPAALQILAHFDQMFVGQSREEAEKGFRAIVDQVIARRFGPDGRERLVPPGFERT